MSEARQRRPYGEAAALEEAEGLRRTAEREAAALDAARAAGHNPWPTAEDRAGAAQGAAPAAPFDLSALGDEPAERAALRAALDARGAAEEDRALAAADLDRADRAVAGLAAEVAAFADLDAQLIEHEQRVIVAGLAADVPPALAARQRERAYLTDRLDRARQVRDRLAAAVAAADAPLAVARAAAAQAAARGLATRAVVRAEELRAVEQATAQLRGELSALSTCWLGAQSVPPRPATADRLRPAAPPARERLPGGERDAGRPGEVAPRLRRPAGGPRHAAALGHCVYAKGLRGPPDCRCAPVAVSRAGNPSRLDTADTSGANEPSPAETAVEDPAAAARERAEAAPNVRMPGQLLES